MSRRSLLLLLAPLLTAQEPAPPGPSELVAIAARRLLRQAPDEEALLLLWQAEDQLRDQPAAASETAAQIPALLLKADPLAAARTQAFADAAKKILEVAQQYRLRRLFELADDRVRAAALWDPDAAQKERLALTSARGPVKPAAPAAPTAAAPAPAPEQPLLARMTMKSSAGAWQLTGAELSSPVPKNKEPEYWLSGTTHTDDEIDCEIKLGQGNAGAELMFGVKTLDDLFMAGVYQFNGGRIASLRCERVAGGGWKSLGEQRGPSQVGDGFHLLAVRVHGHHVQLELDGRLRLELDVDRDAHGAIGFQVAAVHGNQQGAVFRNLTVGPPPPAAPTPQELRDRQQAERQGAARAAMQRGETLLKDRKGEAAVLELSRARAAARELDAGAERDALETALDKLLQQADPLYPRRKTAEQEIAAGFAALAERYVAAGLPRAALVIAARAATFDPRGAAPLLARVAAAVAARDAAEAETRQQELQPPPLDDGPLRELFAKGRHLLRGGRPFVVDGAGARVLGLTDGAQTALLPPGKPLAGGRYGVHVHLVQPGAIGGLAFDAHGDNDYALALLHRTAQQLRLIVRRCYLGRWQTLADRQVPFPVWRLGGWFELQLDDLADAVVVRAGDVEVKLERPRLGAMGPVGLAAEAGCPGPVDVEFRGFRLLP